MHNVAPNLSALIGEVIGARLISHAGSLTNLAKYPVRCSPAYISLKCSEQDDKTAWQWRERIQYLWDGIVVDVSVSE